MGQKKDVAASEPQTDEPDLSYIEPDLRHLARPIGWFKPNPHEVNTHDERNLAAITESLRDHGQMKNVVTNAEGEMAAGWGTFLAAAQALGWQYLAAVASAKPEDNLRKYALLDNRTAQLARFDDAALLAELVALDEEQGTKPEEVGWNAEEFAKLAASLIPPEPIESPEPPDDFPEADEDLPTEHTCPKCGYKWSGGR
jgi:ParB-like chromosome segregation protein Spo0J